jgi:DNA repair exonuclease SbcCD ATPase subunit
MSFTEQEKRRLIALTRQLKEQKGLTIKKSELDQDIAHYRKAQEEIIQIKDQHRESPAVTKAAEESYGKLQSIIDDLNDYMGLIYPEGLIDLGSDGHGQTAMASG